MFLCLSHNLGLNYELWNTFLRALDSDFPKITMLSSFCLLVGWFSNLPTLSLWTLFPPGCLLLSLLRVLGLCLLILGF